ncbi:NAD(P)/FAD-dependent oxidoreductase [Paenibacillus sp. YIM B09110]|uniref:NAD(P)/FAD-dependent oxidoreductase n=1 Tax=Paenibacillus sp. YIM B09110 TaxID=3126102 RepID=UPI00301DE25F
MLARGMVIVGAGEAGARAAEQLRERGWNGEITMIGNEIRAPYERPPLSKNALTNEEEPEPTYVHKEDRLTQLNIKLITGTSAVRIDRSAHVIHLNDGGVVPYERLLLALGAQPRKLPYNTEVTGKLLYLRSFEDAIAIRSKLLPGNKIVVIGGGFIGLEVAASARTIGCDVTLIEVGSRILTRGVPIEIASLVEEQHRAAGVTFKLGTAIDQIRQSPNGHVIEFADGTSLHCDAIIVGIGAVPVTDLAADNGLSIDNGICADAKLATSDPDIFAAGDCCSFPHEIYDGKRIRLEAWRNAQDQGIHAAGSMLGAVHAYKVIPWFWSDQYEKTLQVVGFPDYGSRTVQRMTKDGSALFFHLTEDNRLVAASGFGSPSLSKEIRVAEMLIERGYRQEEPGVLENGDVKLKSLL